ncbi:MAG: hypothetical protein HYX48_02145 [Chlamydiales bacterium]|nr:hypothetical protein [Chlamydiales bacterium]
MSQPLRCFLDAPNADMAFLGCLLPSKEQAPIEGSQFSPKITEPSSSSGQTCEQLKFRLTICDSSHSFTVEQLFQSHLEAFKAGMKAQKEASPACAIL